LTSPFSNKVADGSTANSPIAAAQQRTSCTFDIVFMVADDIAGPEGACLFTCERSHYAPALGILADERRRSLGTARPHESAFSTHIRIRRKLSTGGMDYFFACPYCGERISMVLDISVKGQIYVENCEVCRRPIKVRQRVTNDEVRQFEACAVGD
jgi:hypothetical protein